MTDTPTKFKGRWKYDQILQTKRQLLRDLFQNSTREEILEKLVETHAAIEGIRYTLDALDSRGYGNGYSRGCIHATSAFFPDYLGTEDGDEDDGNVYVTKWKEEENGKKNCYFEAQEPTWDGEQSFNHRDSLSVPCSTYVDDRVEILAAHEQAMAAYISGGAITFGDVRILQAVLHSRDLVLLESLAEEEKSA